ncbi:MAG: tryptophan--tRNA ligase [Planctomycetota bacterium]
MRILSGTTPTGELHLGNYFGAVRQWVELQSRGEALFFIADYHALTTVRDAETMASNVRAVALAYLALGLDPERTVLFRHSDVPEVCELTWILSTVTPMGLLERCHAYKDKVAQGISSDHGLFTYPVLMASDILIYRSDLVPVGQDQKQHVEVTRDIAIKFNQSYGDVFPLPEAHILEQVAKVPGVDGRKMSKSYCNDIRIFDPEKQVRKKIFSIVTDSAGLEDAKEPQGNIIFELYKLLAPPEKVQELAERFRAGGMGYGHAKESLFEEFMDRFGSMRKKHQELANDLSHVEEILESGARKARNLARETMEAVREATGLSRRLV